MGHTKLLLRNHLPDSVGLTVCDLERPQDLAAASADVAAAVAAVAVEQIMSCQPSPRSCPGSPKLMSHTSSMMCISNAPSRESSHTAPSPSALMINCKESSEFTTEEEIDNNSNIKTR